MRVACLWVPQFVVQAWRRAEPELQTVPLAVHEEQRLVAVSDEGVALGVALGMGVSQARALCPAIVERRRSTALERSAWAALEDLGAAFSPHAEARLGRWLALDVTGWERLWRGEEELGGALEAGARRIGFRVRVGVARDKLTAQVVARASDGVTVVPPGAEAARLSLLPVSLLAPSPEVAVLLTRWGVRRIGELASLPADGLGLRLGKEGAYLAEVARGMAEAPLVPRPEAVVFEEAIDFDWPVENLQPLWFVLRRMLEQLLLRLGCRGLGAAELTLELKLGEMVRNLDGTVATPSMICVVPVAASTRDPGTLLLLLRTRLEQQPPPAAVLGLILRIRGSKVPSAQLGLFEPPRPSPDRLAGLLARLAALVGDGQVGVPALLDSHHPDPVAMAPFVEPASKAIRAPVAAAGMSQPSARLGFMQPTPLALHAFRPPRPATVRRDRGALRYLTADGFGGQVLTAAGPFRLQDGWWLPVPIDRDYYDVELSDGAVYRLFEDRRGGGWFIDGCYE